MKEKNCQFLSVQTAHCFTRKLTVSAILCFKALILITTLNNTAVAQDDINPGVASPITQQPVAEPKTNIAGSNEQALDSPSTVINPEKPVSDNLEELKKAALELNRDLLILEEELLFPANTQLVVFLSMDVGQFFKIDSVKLSINDQLVASHLYTEYENDSLIRGGIHRLHIGNLKQGEHEITAVFTGLGPDNRKYKRAATIVIEKDDDAIMLELQVRDATSNMQPTFDIKEWEL